MPTLEQECDHAIGRLRAAMIGLYDDLGADPTSPQDVARRFKLNKTFTWNVARLLQAPDGLAAAQHVPGTAAVKKLLDAAEAHGATNAKIEAVRRAMTDFEQVVEIHLGDRSTLDLVVDSVPNNGSGGLELSRKRAYVGNSGIYGAQAKTKLVTCMVIPHEADEAMLDIAMVRGHVGVRRLRSSATLAISRMRQWSGSPQAIATEQWEPIDPAGRACLMPEFSRGDVPSIDAIEADGGTDFVIQPGPIGNRGAFDCFFGDMVRAAANRYRSPEDSMGEFGATVTIPAEHLIIDLIFDARLGFMANAEAFVYAHSFLNRTHEGTWDESMVLPIGRVVRSMPGKPPAVATPLVPRYADIVRSMADRLGCALDACAGARFELKYPPLGSNAVLRFALPERG